MERNNLMSKCYPKIKEYCREKHGLEFQVRIQKNNKSNLLIKQFNILELYHKTQKKNNKP